MLKIYGLVSVFLCLALAQSAPRPKCVPKHVPVYRKQVPSKSGDVCYAITQPTNWQDAKRKCRILFHGNFADIPAADYVDFDAIVQNQMKFGNSDSDDLLWFGGRAVDGVWQWSVEVPKEGYTYKVKQAHKHGDPVWTPMNYANWKNGQPPPAKDGQCVAVSAVSGKWQPLDCEKELPSVCQLYTFF